MVGRDEQARIGLHGRRERAAHMPEQLALEQGFRDRAAVDRNEGPVAAGAGCVDRARDQLLADSALPRDQHGARGAGGPGDLLAKGAHHAALADEGLRDRPRLMRVPRAQALSPQGLALLEHALHARAQLVDAERLLEIIPCAMPKGGDGGLEARVGRHENDRRPRIEQARALQHREAPDTGHDDVGEDDVELLLRDSRDRLLAAARGRDVIPVGRQRRGQHLLHGNHVVYHENRGWHDGVTRVGPTRIVNQHRSFAFQDQGPLSSPRGFSHLRIAPRIARFPTFGKSFTLSSLSTPLRPCP